MNLNFDTFQPRGDTLTHDERNNGILRKYQFARHGLDPFRHRHDANDHLGTGFAHTTAIQNSARLMVSMRVSSNRGPIPSQTTNVKVGSITRPHARSLAPA